jgi:hypothetical protein
LRGAIAVDEREIALVKPAGLEKSRAGLDGSVAGSPDANLAIVGYRRDNKPGGNHADQARASPFSNVFYKQHQTPPLFGQDLFKCTRRRVLQLILLLRASITETWRESFATSGSAHWTDYFFREPYQSENQMFLDLLD